MERKMHVVELYTWYDPPHQNQTRKDFFRATLIGFKPISDRVDWFTKNGHEWHLEETSNMEFIPMEYFNKSKSTSHMTLYYKFMKKICLRKSWLLYAVLSSEQLVEYNLVFGGE